MRTASGRASVHGVPPDVSAMTLAHQLTLPQSDFCMKEGSKLFLREVPGGRFKDGTIVMVKALPCPIPATCHSITFPVYSPAVTENIAAILSSDEFYDRLCTACSNLKCSKLELALEANFFYSFFSATGIQYHSEIPARI